MPDEGSRLIASPLYRVTDKDGRDIAYTAEQKGGVLTVTVDEDLAILTGRLSGIRTLKAQGVEKIVFVTKGAASAFLLSDLLDKGEGGDSLPAHPRRQGRHVHARRKHGGCERHSHQAVSEISESMQAGRHKLCLPALSAEKQNGRRLSMARSVHLDH